MSIRETECFSHVALTTGTIVAKILRPQHVLSACVVRVPIFALATCQKRHVCLAMHNVACAIFLHKSIMLLVHVICTTLFRC